MPISVPSERVYYCEPGEDEEGLLCWVPVEALRAMVDDGQMRVDKSILKHYPVGVDIPVTEEDFTCFKTTYGLEFPFPSERLLLAFEGLRESDSGHGFGCEGGNRGGFRRSPGKAGSRWTARCSRYRRQGGRCASIPWCRPRSKRVEDTCSLGGFRQGALGPWPQPSGDKAS